MNKKTGMVTMNRQTYGFLSLLLILAAVLTATYAIYQFSFFWTLLYLVGLMLSSLVIIFSFCTKCPSRNKDCSHIIPGKLTCFFPRRPGRGLYPQGQGRGGSAAGVPDCLSPVLAAHPARVFRPVCRALPGCGCNNPVLCLQRMHQLLLPVLPGRV